MGGKCFNPCVVVSRLFPPQKDVTCSSRCWLSVFSVETWFFFKGKTPFCLPCLPERDLLQFFSCVAPKQPRLKQLQRWRRMEMGGAGHTFRHIGTSIHCQKHNLYTNAPASKKKKCKFFTWFHSSGKCEVKEGNVEHLLGGDANPFDYEKMCNQSDRDRMLIKGWNVILSYLVSLFGETPSTSLTCRDRSPPIEVLLIIRKFNVRPPLNVIDQANAADHLLLPPKNNVVIRQRNCSRLLHISIGRNVSQKI